MKADTGNFKWGIPVKEILDQFVQIAEELKAENLLENFIQATKADVVAGGETIVLYRDGLGNVSKAVNCKPMNLAVAEKIYAGAFVSDTFGLCPECRHYDAHFHYGGYRWSVCNTHKMRWRVICAEQVKETMQQQSEAWKQFAEFKEVKPFYFSALLTPSQSFGLNEYLDSLGATKTGG